MDNLAVPVMPSSKGLSGMATSRPFSLHRRALPANTRAICHVEWRPDCDLDSDPALIRDSGGNRHTVGGIS